MDGEEVNPCKIPLPSDYQGQAHKKACSKGGQQDDAFETVRFAVTTFPPFCRVFARHAACTGTATCDDAFIVAPKRYN